MPTSTQISVNPETPILPSPLSSTEGDPRRFLVVAVAALGLAVCYADRANMSIAIVSMVADLHLSPGSQGLVLSSFFVGYILTQAMGGALADRFGGKGVLAFGGGASALFTSLTPVAARGGLVPLLLCRVALGAGEGVTFPAMHSLIARWSPPSERSRFVAAATASAYTGSVIALPLSTALAQTMSGWPTIFYSFGAFGGVWVVAWQLWGRSSPAVGKKVSRSVGGEQEDGEEEQLLSESHPQTSARPPRHPLPPPPSVPWRFLLYRREVRAILVVQFCNSWGFFILLNWLPTYYIDRFGVDIRQLGYFAVLPYAVQGIMGFVAGALGDYAIHTLGMRVVVVRKVAQVVGSMGMALCLLAATFIVESAPAGMAFLTLGLGLNAFTMVGVSVSQHDIAPLYAGAIFALGNMLAGIPAIVGTAITGCILEVTGRNWGLVWSAVALFYCFGSVVWVAWAGGEMIIDE